MTPRPFRLPDVVYAAVIGWFGTKIVFAVIGFLQGGARPMYIEPWLFLVLVFGTALSVSGLLIGTVAIAALWLRRRPRRPKKAAVTSGLVGPDGRSL